MRLPAWITAHPLRALLGALAVVCLFSLFNHPLIPSMEPRFAEAVREMAAAGRYLIPIKNGIPYIEYPPLYYWLSLLGKGVGLPDAAAVRLPTALALLFWVWELGRLQKLVRPHWPPLLLPLCGAALPIVLGNFFLAQTDGLLALGVLIALNGFIQQRMTGSITFPWRFWWGAALAVAAKGPVGLVLSAIPAGLELIIAPLLIVAPTWQAWKGLPLQVCRSILTVHPFKGGGFILLTGGPWYLAAGLTVGWDFCRAILIYQNFTRFTVGFDHFQPWFYYLKILWPNFFPLCLLLPLAITQLWKRRAEFHFRFAHLWFFGTLLFFSLSSSKQQKYLLPAAPAFLLIALLAGEDFFSVTGWRRLYTGLRRFAGGLLATFAVLLIFVMPRYNDRLGARATYQTLRGELQKNPGRLFTFRWPRANTLYELGAPLPYFRSAKALYDGILAGEIKPGDYLLADTDFLPAPDGKGIWPLLSPVPAAPHFDPVLRLPEGHGSLVLYRLKPGAAAAPRPETPWPPPSHWWEKFDTD